ncbi:hypothetical protein O181_014306 [Austropuccinia psidii MF-1]|uniref:Uncharacterized protein n=1 Tax=Austropuccinia psidii MF-1 TaxID=1389203 RepID=A0A9Q3C1H5_9BASI|nr:hypothetical protein [Austropuccinia psidii MF-1]
MCQHCATKTNSSPKVDMKGVAFTPFQYKNHIQNSKAAIETRFIPNFPTSASDFESLPIFPNDYSQLTHTTFSTPSGLNSTAQKPYSGSQNPPLEDLGIIISAILSLYPMTSKAQTQIPLPPTALLINSH